MHPVSGSYAGRHRQGCRQTASDSWKKCDGWFRGKGTWPFTIGDNSKIAAGAVVLEEIPANATAVGVPARVVKLDGVRVVQDLDQIHMPDPVGQEFSSLEERLTRLCQCVSELEKENRELKAQLQKVEGTADTEQTD